MSNFGIDSYINSINQAQPAGLGQNGRGSLSSKAQNAVALGKSNAGDVVTGEVVGINGKTVQIQLDSKNVVTARMENNMEVKVGQSLAFEVKSNSNGQISLSPLFTNTTMNPAMIKALSMASLPLNEQTINMTSAMMDNGMGIDRQSMQQMYAFVNEFPDTEPANLIAMKAMGIDINEDTIGQFEIYKNNEHQILNASDELSEQLLELTKELPNQTVGEIIDAIQGQVNPALVQEMKANIMEQEAASVPVTEELEVVEEESFVGPFGASFASAQKTVADETAEKVAVNEEIQGAKEELVFEIKGNEDTALNRLLEPQDRLEFAKTLHEFGVSNEAVDSILNGEAAPREVMSYIQSALELSSQGLGDSEGLHKLLNSKGFSNLFKDTMNREWTIGIGDEFNKENVKNLYEKISQSSEKLVNILANAGKADSQASVIANNLQQNLNFMNDINQMFQYIQVPLKMTNEDAHADLFVYTNKKKLSEKDGEVSALLHLEMQTLGLMDIHVSMKDRDHVNTHFYLEDDAMLDFVSEHLGELDSRLSERGYNNKSVATIREKNNATENEVSNKAVATMLGLDKHRLAAKYSFDMRA